MSPRLVWIFLFVFCVSLTTFVRSAIAQTLTINNSTGSGDITDFVTGGATPTTKAQIDPSGDFITGLTGAFQFSGFSGSPDTGVSRGATKLVDIGSGASGDATGFIKTAQTLMVTSADVSITDTNLHTISGLTLTLPSVSVNWGFTCDLVISQGTATTNDKLGVQTATNAPAALTAGGFVGTIATGTITDVANITPQPVVTFTTSAGTKYPVHFTGGIEAASASGTTLNIMMLTAVSGNPITIYRGSSCWVY